MTFEDVQGYLAQPLPPADLSLGPQRLVFRYALEMVSFSCKQYHILK